MPKGELVYLTSFELNRLKALLNNLAGAGGSGLTDHSKLTNLDYAHAGHSGFEPAASKGNLTAAAPIVFDNARQVIGGAAQVSIPKATASVDGYIDHNDFATFQAGSGFLNDATRITKSADQDVTNSSTLVSDNDLYFSITASHRYSVFCHLILAQSNATGHVKIGFYVSSGTMTGTGNATGFSGPFSASGAQTTQTMDLNTQASDLNQIMGIVVAYSFIPSSNGTFYLQFANTNASSGRISRVCKNSRMYYNDIT